MGPIRPRLQLFRGGRGSSSPIDLIDIDLVLERRAQCPIESIEELMERFTAVTDERHQHGVPVVGDSGVAQR